MKYQKFVAALTLVALVLMVMPVQAAVSQDSLTYLQNQDQSNEWVVMALKAAGQNPSANAITTSNLNSATNIERKILGVVAGGGNPFAFNSTDLVALLDSKRNNNQIGETSLLNDDMWGILAYLSAGISSSDARVAESKAFLLSKQNNDGGWGYAPNTESDSNDTAIAVNALVKAGVSASDEAIQNALAYLQGLQKTDGGYAFSSNFGADTASTAWVISALLAAGITPDSRAIDFLATLKTADGSYKWMSTDAAGNAGMTAYAVIALSNASYPVAVYSGGSSNNNSSSNNSSGSNNSNNNTNNNNSTPAPTNLIPFRIEGSQKQVCQGEVAASNALQVITLAADLCHFTYTIENLSFGKYLSGLGNDQAAGTIGWLYLVNWQQPSVGASDYKLKAGDYVTWFFGDFAWPPLRISEEARNNEKNEIRFVVESFNQFSWSTVSGATVYLDEQSFVTNGTGQVTATLSNGVYQVWAEKQNYIRSNRLSVSLGQIVTQKIDLQVNITENNQTSNNVGAPIIIPNPTTKPAVSFNVDVTSVKFGDLKAGQTSQADIKITNTNASKELQIFADVQGDQAFTKYLYLDNLFWSLFNKVLKASEQVLIKASLKLPDNYAEKGIKSGQLIIWAKL